MTRLFPANRLLQTPKNEWQQHAHSIPSRVLQEQILCQAQNFHPNGIFYGDNPLSHTFSALLLHLVLVTTITRIVRFILKPLKQPMIVSQIIVSFLSYIHYFYSYVKFCCIVTITMNIYVYNIVLPM